MYSDGGAQSPFSGGGFRVYTHTSTFGGNRPEARDVVEAYAEVLEEPGGPVAKVQTHRCNHKK